MEVEKIAGLPPEIAERIAPYVPDTQWSSFADDIHTGRNELFSINNGESLCVTRFESRWSELVVCVYVGKNAMDFMRILKKVAIKNGATTMRYHSKRKGMARLLSDLGAVVSETVYTVAL